LELNVGVDIGNSNPHAIVGIWVNVVIKIADSFAEFAATFELDSE
jgi:hypothetical protein